MFLEGMKVGLGVILIMIGLLHSIRKEKVELGIICLIIGTGSFYGIFFEQYHWDLIFSVFFADYRWILVPSLAYIYFLRRANLQIHLPTEYLKHITIPSIVLITYWILKIGMSDFFLNHVIYIVTIFRAISLAIILFYFIKGLIFLRKIKEVVKPIAYRNFKLIYILLLGHLLVVLTIVFAETVRTKITIPQFRTFDTDVIAVINFLSFIPLLLFAILELTFLKKYFFNELLIKQSQISSYSEIENFIQNELEINKSYTDVKFNLSMLLKEYLISENEFRKYIKAEFGENLTEFTNRLKVEHFKKLLTDPENDRYDLPGLAKISGFNSKATFYRVFKQLVGTTPNEYKDSLKRE